MSRAKQMLKRLASGVRPLRRQFEERAQLGEELAGYRALEQNYLAFPPGHFYSPLPDFDDILARPGFFEQAPSGFKGVTLNEGKQLDLLQTLRSFYGTVPFEDERQEGMRFYYDNEYYGYPDAIILYAMIRHLKPRAIIEVGSGYSSALILDTVSSSLEGRTHCTFIEPFTERLDPLLFEGDLERPDVSLRRQRLQDVPADTFDRLGENDILFIDSSHVSKIDSDVNHLIFEVIPRLAEGVVVHFHDIYYPFEYPKVWVEQRRAWNEIYLVRSFLEFNSAFEIKLFTSYMIATHRDFFSREMPLCLKSAASSLWLQRVS